MVKNSSKKNAKPGNTSLKKKNPISKQKTKKKQKEVQPADPKKNIVQQGDKDKRKIADDELVEFYGQWVKPLDREKMETIVPILRRRATVADLKNFVVEFPAFQNGILVLKKHRGESCTTCSKFGHPPEVCPKRWKDGKWFTICNECKQHECQEWNVCKLCRKGDHCSKKCPERRKNLEDEEDEDESVPSLMTLKNMLANENGIMS